MMPFQSTRLVTSVLLYAAETWTVLPSNLKTLEPLHMKCQRQILQVNWQQFVRNEKISATTGLPSMSDIISRRRNAVFGHIARLDTTVPAHQALRAHVSWSLGRNPDPRWKQRRRRVTIWSPYGLSIGTKIGNLEWPWTPVITHYFTQYVSFGSIWFYANV